MDKSSKKIIVTAGSLFAAWICLYVLEHDILITLPYEKLSAILDRACPTPVSFATIIGATALIAKAPSSRLYWNDYAWSLLLSIVVVAGYAINRTDSFYPLYATWASTPLAFLILIGIFVQCCCGLKWLKHLWMKASASKRFARLRIKELFEEKPFLCPMLCLLAAWAPYLLLNYPAVVEWDAFKQIEQFLGIHELKAHWPLASTVLMGSFVQFGEIVGSYNIGVFLFVLLQTIVCASSLAYSIFVLTKTGCSIKVRMIATLVFSFAVVYPAYATCVTKDSLYTAAVVFMTSLLVQMLYGKRSPGCLAAFFVSALAVSVFRSNGVYIVIFEAIALLFFSLSKKQRKGVVLAIPLILAGTLYFAYNSIAIPSMGLKQSPFNEALSIPLQQTARYCTNHPDEVTDHEREIINDVMGFDAIVEDYDYRRSDFVRMHFEGGLEEFKQYLPVWFSQLCKHPETYIGATFANVYGFIDPFFNTLYPYGAVVQGAVNHADTPTDIALFSRPQFLEIPHKALCAYEAVSLQFPATMVFSNTGIASQTLIYLLLYALRKKCGGEVFLALLPSLITLLVCFASMTYHTNGARYALPVFFLNPFILGIVVTKVLKPSKALKTAPNSLNA